MMNKYIIGLATVIGMTATSCSNDAPETKECGTLSMASIACVIDEVQLGRSVDVDALIVEIYDGEDQVGESYTYGELPEALILDVSDNYLVKVHSPEPTEEETLGAAYYEGEQPFVIKANVITEVETVVCSMKNVQVTVTFSDALADLLADDAVVEVVYGEAALLFSKEDITENKSGYFDPAESSVTMTATLTGVINGDQITQENSAEVNGGGEHHIFKFSVKTADGISTESNNTDQE